MRTVLPVALALVALPAVARAQASDVDAALELESQGRLAEALSAFEAALDAEGHGRQDLATIYLHAALLQVAAGQTDAARDSMYRLLSVEPEPVLPDWAPPTVAALLEDARRLWGGRRLHAEVSAPSEVGPEETATVHVSVRDDVPGMVAAAALVVGGRIVARQEGGAPFDLALPGSIPAPGAAVVAEVRLLDGRGSTLWETEFGEIARRAPEEAVFAAGGLDEAPEEPTPPARRGALGVAGWVLLGVGLAAAGCGTALVVLDRTPTGAQRTTEVGLEEEILNTDLGGWTLVGVGAAALVASVVLLVLGLSPEGDEPAASRPGSATSIGLD